MVRVEKVRWNDGQRNAVLDLQVSTAAELPDIWSMVGGWRLKEGSTAQIVQQGEFVTLDKEGTWYPEQS